MLEFTLCNEAVAVVKHWGDSGFIPLNVRLVGNILE